MFRDFEVPKGFPAACEGHIAGQGIVAVADVYVGSIGNSQAGGRVHIKDSPGQAVDDNLPPACRVFQLAGVGVGGGENVACQGLAVEVKGALGEGEGASND